MTTSLRLILLTALVTACPGDDGDTDSTAGNTTSGTQTTTVGNTTGGTDDSTTGGPTTEPTTAGPTTDDTTGGPTTDDTTAGPTTDDSTSTTDGSTTGTATTDDTSGGTTDDTTGGVGGLSWEKDVYPVIVEGTCGCHGGGSGGLKMTNAMDSYMNIVDVDATQVPFKRVAPGDPDNSYFLAKVKGTAGMAPFNSGSPAQMPKGGAPKGQMAIDILTQWIADGALP